MNKPLIGINCDLDMAGEGRVYRSPYLFIYTSYFDAVIRAGGIPILLPFFDNPDDIDDVIERLDGLLLTGCWNDLSPESYGQKNHPSTNPAADGRLQFDISLTTTALKRQVPILGICSGMQLLNIAAGGDLIQHIADKYDTSIEHLRMDIAEEFVHDVQINKDSLLYKIVEVDNLKVNSTHHQALGRIADGFKVIAKAPDGVIEAVESDKGNFFLAVQWHPERLCNHKSHAKLFEALIEHAQKGN